MKTRIRNSLRTILVGHCLALLPFLADNAGAASQWWDNNGASAATSGTWDTTTANWASSATLTASTAVFGSGNFVTFAAGSTTISALTITVPGAVSCEGIGDGETSGGSTSGASVTALTFSGAGSISLPSGTWPFECGNAGPPYPTITINVPITGPGGIIQHNNGSLALYGNNTYTGGTTLTGGQLVYYNNNSSFGAGTITVTSSSGAIVNGSTSALTIPNNFVFSAAENFNLAGGNPVASVPGTTFTGTFTLPTSGTTTLYTSSTATEEDQISGVISGASGLSIQDSGTMILSGANTYTGPTSIGGANGTTILSVSSLNKVSGGSASSSLGAPTTAANGTIAIGTTTFAAKLIYTGAGETSDRVINLAGTTGGATIEMDGTGPLDLTSAFTATGAGAKTLTLQGTSTANNTISGAIVNSSSGSVAVTKAQAGTWVLSGASTYTGTNIITGGTLSVGADNNLGAAPSSAAVNSIILAGGTLSANSSFTLNANRGITMTVNSALDTASGATLSYGGIIAGAFNLTKTSAGTLVLSANHSTYSGNTIINAGTIETGGDNGAGGVGNLGKVPTSFVANNITLGGGSLIGNNAGFAFSANRGITLTANSVLGSLAGDTTTFPQIIAGNFNLTINGGGNTGTVILSGVNTYSGATTISGGRLIGVAGSSSANSAVEVQTGGNTLGISITNNTQQWTCAGLTIDDNTATLDFNFSSLVAPSTIVAPLNVNGPVTFTGTPTVTVEAGSLPAGTGTYPLITGTSISGTPPTSVILQGRAVGNLSVVGNTLYLNITANADPIDWAVSGAGIWDINTSQNWDDSTGAATYYLQSATPGDPVLFDDTYITAAPTITLNTTVSPAVVTVNNSTYNYEITGVGGIAGNSPLTKQGSATLVLDCTNTYTGGTTINGGTLQLGDGVTNNGVVAGNILNNASLVFSNFNIQTDAGVISGTGSLAASGPNALTLSGVNTYSGPTTINAALTIGGAGQLGGGTYAANIANNGIFTNNSTAAQTYSGVVSGAGTLVENAGTLTLSGVNTYSGPTTITGGTLAIGGAGQLGSGTYSQNITDNGTLTDGSSASQTLSGVISGTGALVNSGAGTLTLSGANTYTGGTTISAGIVTVNAIADSGTSGINASTNTLTLSGGELQYTGSAAVTSGRGVTVTGTASTIDLPNGSLTLTNQVKNTAACVVTKTSSGTLTLGGTNDNSFLGLTVNGGTVILNKTLIGHAVGSTTIVNSGGTLQLAGSGYNQEIYGGVSLTVNSGGVFDMSGQNNGFTSLTISGNGTGSGALINSAASTTSIITNTAAAGMVLTGNTAIGGSGNLSLISVITGSFSLTNIGTGVLTLNSNNTYSGSTVISSGTIALGKNGSIVDSPAIVIGSGATFDVSGKTSTLALAAGQQIQSPGTGTSTTSTINMSSSAGLTLSAGGLAFTSYAGGSTAPLTAASAGSLNLNGAPVAVTTTIPLAHGTYTLIAASGSATVTGSPGALTVSGSGLVAGNTASLSVSSGALNLVVVAPPTIANPVVTTNASAGLSWKISIAGLASAAGWSDPNGYTVTLSSVGPTSFNGTNVTSDANYIYYNGPVTAADHFSYTITNGVLAASGTVDLVPVSPTAPVLNSPGVNTSGNPTFSGNGIPGYIYGVESATSISGPWIEAGNVTAGSNGSWSFTDASQVNPQTIFYRVYYPDNPSNPPQ